MKMTRKTIACIRRAFLVITIIIAMLSVTGCSSGKKEPWEELSVSKSEYMDVYNSIKYG